MTTLTSFFKTDLVDDHTANDMNELIAAALRAEFANTETISATKELTDNDCQFQFITASGADRTVELAPEATTNHVQAIYNSGATYNVVVKDDSGTYTFATLAPDEWAIFIPFNAEGWRKWAPPEEKYKLSVTVVSNDLILALQHLDGTDPTPTRPLCITIAGVKRYATAATSITLADATNWMGLGGSAFATIEQDLFAYAVWDSNSSVIALSVSRLPYGTLVSDFNSTSTNEGYLGNYANFTSTDNVKNIGRFAATLSAGAGYTWTVPTFTTTNKRDEPTFETRVLTYAPTLTGFSVNPATNIYNYRIRNKILDLYIRQTANGTSNATGFTISLPLAVKTLTNYQVTAIGGFIVNNGVAANGGSGTVLSAGTTVAFAIDQLGNVWTNVNGKRIADFSISYDIAN